MSDNLDFAGPNPFTGSPKTVAPLGVKALFESSNEFREFPEDFGRESLGIFDFSHPDFGRESLSFRDDFGRESLGIINLNALDIGRESIGITNIRTYDFIVSNVNLPQVPEEKEGFSKSPQKNSDSVPSIKICDLKVSNENLPEVFLSRTSDNSLLNTAFLNPQKCSVSSSISSMYPSFNSGSLESTGPSRIFSASSSSRTDVMNDAFEDTSDFIKRMKLFVRSSTSTYSPIYQKVDSSSELRRRISSLPTTLESKYEDFEEAKMPSLESNSLKKLETEAEEIVADSDNDFNDSVFIEGKHFASRIADGSFVEDENDMLDSIREPEDLQNVTDVEPVKYDKETVFKTVDKMFVSTEEAPSVSDDKNSPSLKSLDKNNDSHCSKTSNSDSKSKEAMEMISTLSEILNSDNPSDKQKSEGKNLLSSLAEILLSSASTKSRSFILDDSGHSSIESEQVAPSETGECYEVLDLRKKSSSETNIDQMEPEVCVPLDLSLKSKSVSEKNFVSPKIMPPRFHRTQQKSLISNLSSASNCSASSNEGRNLSDFSKKLRPKKSNEKLATLKKGPLRAVLPVDNMARRNSGKLKITPTRSESKSSNKLKKTSTPINESNLKPMAQSTPDNVKTTCPVSPLARPNSSVYSSPKQLNQKLSYSRPSLPLPQNKSLDSKNKTSSLLKRGFSGELSRPSLPLPQNKSLDSQNKTSSLLKRGFSGELSKTSLPLPQNKSLDSKNKTSSLLKRGFSGELKKPQNLGKPLSRSSSVEEKLLSKIGSNVKLSSRHSSPLSKTETKSSVLKENRSKFGIRPSLSKKVGKENQQ